MDVEKLTCRSLNRAALAGASLAKERKDLKRMEQNEAADSESRDVNQPWLDPMANPNDKTFASDRKLDQAGLRSAQMPAWKAANKVSSYGKITSLSIQEQRKSLPIYKLRNELVQAIKTVSSTFVARLTSRTKSWSLSEILDQERLHRWRSTWQKKVYWKREG
jgi:ATP-dependent RNA helicase DHX8/PRP22